MTWPPGTKEFPRHRVENPWVKGHPGLQGRWRETVTSLSNRQCPAQGLFLGGWRFCHQSGTSGDLRNMFVIYIDPWCPGHVTSRVCCIITLAHLGCHETDITYTEYTCKETPCLVSMVCGQFVIQRNSLESRALGLPHACLPQKPVLYAHTVIVAGCNR